ncbi:MAG TPA: glycosyltransferase [Chitinophagales bacterium]|nr:glycosyltransferase [Chitinophagales bacterium]
MEVSTCIITYNQQAYVAQAIESALMQECTFSNEIIICDDNSTDNTTNIIKTYAAKYPDRIKPYFSNKNLGMLRNWQKALTLCSGKYIALLEGDDYWTDKNKLQKQYDILNQHTDCVICFTNAEIKYESGEPGFTTYVTLKGEKFTRKDLMGYNFIPTCSVLMRNYISDAFFHPAYFNSPFADWIIHILNSRHGNLYFLNEFTCTYRIHGTGVWAGSNAENQLLKKLRAIDCISNIITENELQQVLKQTRQEALQKICHYYKQNKRFLDYFKYRTKLLFNR